MAQVKLCGVLTQVRGQFVDDNKLNATGKHGVRINPSGTMSLVQYGARNLSTHPIKDSEKQRWNNFKQASELRAMILNDSALKATWAQRFKLDTATKCVTLSGYIQSMASKGHVDSDGSYK